MNGTINCPVLAMPATIFPSFVAEYTERVLYKWNERSRVIPKPTPMCWFVILSVLAIGLALGLPPDPHAVAQLHTSPLAYRVAVATLLVPYVLIWYASFYAFSKLQEYSRSLKDAEDGVAFRKISTGMGAVAFSLVVPTIISLILNAIAAHHSGFKAASVIIDNYMSLFPGLLSFLLLYNGARMLLRTAPGGVEKLDVRWHAPWFLLLSVLFAYFTIENQYRWHPYHLTLWLLIVTFIVPYLYGWTVGILSAYNLHLYARTVRGALYQRPIKQFAGGIATVIVASTVIQFANVTLGQRVDKSLGTVLAIDYGLLIVLAAGLGLMALGTRKLNKIEQV